MDGTAGIGRRSAVISGDLSGESLGGEGVAFAEGDAFANAPIATSSLRRSPTATTPIFFRLSAVSCDSTCASIRLSRKLCSYCSRPRLRSQSPTSMATLHMAWRDNRSVGATRPAEHCAPLRREKNRSSGESCSDPRANGSLWPSDQRRGAAGFHPQRPPSDCRTACPGP